MPSTKKNRRARVRHNHVRQTDCLFYWLRHGRLYVRTQRENVLMCVYEIRTDRGVAYNAAARTAEIRDDAKTQPRSRFIDITKPGSHLDRVPVINNIRTTTSDNGRPRGGIKV